ncbi:MAG: hypothetical protein KatS3mg008_0450 [Acidimicrobiales bacterium]|nr:MAG: hypothetical protein KatS3mg008_0450 [Acidimicrobiales bacterium]
MRESAGLESPGGTSRSAIWSRLKTDSRASLWLIAPALAAGVVPVFVSVAVAASGGWIPTRDVAALAARAWDTLTGLPPLVGTDLAPTELSEGHVVRNLGPVPVWVFGPLYVLTGRSPAALVVTAGAVNVACFLSTVWLARRIGGVPLAVWSSVAVALMQWSLRGEALRDPWGPHLAIMPFVLFCVAAWSLRVGERVALPFLVAAGSFAAQAYWPYVFLVSSVVLWICGGSLWSLWLSRSPHPYGPRATGTRGGILRDRLLLVTLAIGFFMWSGPVAEQLSGGGNIARFVDFVTDGDVPRAGLAAAVERTVTVFGWPPAWTVRTDDVFRVVGGADGADFSTFVVLAATLVFSVVACWRMQMASTGAGVRLASALLAGSLITFSLAPGHLIGTEIHLYRWVWPVGAIVYLTLGWSMWRVSARRLTAATPWRVTLVGSALSVGLTLVGFAQPPVGDDRDGVAYRVLAELARATAAGIAGPGPWRLAVAGAADGHEATMVEALEAEGVQVKVDPSSPYSWGRRRTDGEPSDLATLLITGGTDAAVDAGVVPPEGARWQRVAFVPFHLVSPPAVERALGEQLESSTVVMSKDLHRMVEWLASGAPSESIASALNLESAPPVARKSFEWLLRQVREGRIGPAGVTNPDWDSLPEGARLWAFRLGLFVEPVPDARSRALMSDPFVDPGFDESADSGLAGYVAAPAG